jgi:hypothetical protein
MTERQNISKEFGMQEGTLNLNYLSVTVGQLYSSLVIDNKVITLKDEEGNVYENYKFDMRIKERHQFFNYAIGVPNPHITPWVRPGSYLTTTDTNLNCQNKLEPPEAFSIHRVGIVFSPKCDHASRLQFIENYQLSIILGRKIYFRSPISTLFSVGEPIEGKFGELPDKGMVDISPIPMVIQSQMSFSAEVAGTPFESGYLKMWVVFDGLHARGVQ